MRKPPTSPALTSLRFFAALAIVLYHALLFQGRLPGRLFSVGYIGVPFFFLLSGFVLGYAYLPQSGAADARRFFISRFARIYPLYLAALALDLPHYLHTSLAAGQHAPENVAWHLAASLALVQSWTNKTVLLNGPSWSLSVEAFFYLIFPLAGAALWRVGRSAVFPLGAAVYAGGLLAAGLTSGVAVQTYDPYRHLANSLLGILLSRYAFLVREDSAVQRTFTRLSAPVFLVALLSVATASFFPQYQGLLQHGLLTPVFGAVILVGHNGQGRMVRWLAHPKLVLLGHASYAIYLLHMPVRTLLRVPLQQHSAVIFPAYLAGLICLGVISFRYFELPARAWLLTRAGYASAENGGCIEAKTST